MLVLAIDTSTPAVTAGVVGIDADGVHERSVVVRVNARGHGELLAPSIEQALSDAGIAVGDLDAIVVGVGPGPYTGLRVGLVTAAVLGEALGIPTYGVCSLDGIGARRGDAYVVSDARRREVYWARYHDGVRVEGPDVIRPADLIREPSVPVVGPMAAVFDGTVEDVQVATLVECAADRIRAAAESETLVPLYLRRPDAVVPGTPKTVSQ